MPTAAQPHTCSSAINLPALQTFTNGALLVRLDGQFDLSQLSIEAGARRVMAALERLGRVAPLQADSEDDQLLDPSL